MHVLISTLLVWSEKIDKFFILIMDNAVVQTFETLSLLNIDVNDGEDEYCDENGNIIQSELDLDCKYWCNNVIFQMLARKLRT